MAFGLFKKKEFADVLFTNGTIYTMDPEIPTVESLACKDGMIIALGDEGTIAALRNDATEVIDLKGATLLPGFIQEHGTPVADAFKGSYVELSEAMNAKDILSSIKAFIDRNAAEEHYLAYGYNEKVVNEDTILEFRKNLDNLCDTKPLLLMAADGLHMILNTFANDIVLARAEELDLPAITPPLVTQTLLAVDYELLIKNMFTEAFNAAQHGYTSIFNKATLSYFDNAYRDVLVDAYQNDFLKQRYDGSFLLNRQFSERLVVYNMAQKHTACAELDQKINFDTLYIVCSGNEQSPCFMSDNYLSLICGMVADKGYGIRISAIDKAAALTAMDILGNLKASYKKLYLSVEHNEVLSEDELSEIFTGGIPEYSPRTLFPAKNPEEAIYERTVVAAERMGLSSLCGSLGKGKWADFAIFENNPFLLRSEEELKNCKTTMTVLAGRIVYDKEKDSPADWTKEMTGQLNAMESDLTL